MKEPTELIPNTKNESPWFDWVLIAWTMSSPIPQIDTNQNNAPDCITLSYKDTNAKKVTSKAMLIPAKLICIIEDKLGNISAIVQSCMKTRKKMSVLTYRWQLEYKNVRESKQANAQYNIGADLNDLSPVYHRVSVDCIHNHCLIVPYHKNSHFVMEIIDQEAWASCFSSV